MDLHCSIFAYQVRFLEIGEDEEMNFELFARGHHRPINNGIDLHTKPMLP